VKLPADAVVTDAQGQFVYPSFVELVSDYGLKPQTVATAQRSNYESGRAGAYGWNDAVKADYSAAEYFEADADKAAELRKNGFGTVLTMRRDGILRGRGALVSTGNNPSRTQLLLADVVQGMSFNKGTSKQSYPSSLTGAIALLRQTLLDAAWYEKYGKSTERNMSLEALNRFKKLPFLFEGVEKYDLSRILNVAKEFQLEFFAKGNGDEYQRLELIRKNGLRLAIPLNFTSAPDVNDPYDALRVSIADLKHWENAPFNAAMLHEAGIPFAITADGLKEKDKGKFWERLRWLTKNGLPKETALASLTTVPASWLKTSVPLGTLKTGAPASFFLSTGDVFEDSAVMTQHIIQGVKYTVQEIPDIDVRGEFTLSGNGLSGVLAKVGGNYHQPKAEFYLGDKKSKGTFSINGKRVLMSVRGNDSTTTYRLEGFVDKTSWTGTGMGPDGKTFTWKALRTGPSTGPSTGSGGPGEKKTDGDISPNGSNSSAGSGEPGGEKKNELEKQERGAVWYPQTSFGFEKLPEKKAVLLKNGTIWTSGEPALLVNCDLLMVYGKITGVGQNLKVPADALIIDCTGKHITAGIVDEHSHIGLTRGVNEGGSSNSSEVRMGDVINADDINIYRHLAGGVTTVQQLHGSANAIGGQSSLIKLRWGRTPDELKFENAPGFIKFALGENVKQSNWGEGWRYPQTRLGVEQFFLDQFLKAKEYERERKAKGDEIRKDLRMETLLEIIHGKRFITCHSYIQSEINMLMKVADSVGFKVNTFTHILEGYKVADKMLAHGANASTFSDWWAYKMEVGEAIPYNTAIMLKAGVNVGINSDDAEMARRLNQEAAKTVKYGGLTKEQAWNLVTINPAKMLHIDDRVGSIKTGKDADIVVWSDEPLSIYAKPEQTFVDGVLYFDIKRDAELRKAADAERARIIAKMQKDPDVKSGKAAKPVDKKEHLYHCDDVEE
jgi:imidazolonepropionase-like amidohydrolase